MLWYLESRGIPVPDCPPLIRTPEPRNVRGARFDPARVDKVLNAMRRLRHTQGKWAGRPLDPSPWQVAYIIAPVFGWVAPNDDGVLVRIIRELYVEVPRKNGKTTIASGLALALTFADGEAGAQGIIVAAAKDQAKHAYRPAKLLVEKSPEMRRVGIKATRDAITRASDGAFLAVAASTGDLLHGANVHCALADELHAHRDEQTLEAVTSGTGARDQPLVIIITTADRGKTDSVYARRRRMAEQLASGAIKDPSVYCVVWAVADDADPFAEATQRAANPGYGVSPTAEYLRSAATKARNDPVELATYKRLHLGMRVGASAKDVELAVWDRNAGPRIDEAALAGRLAFGGLDLAATADVTALAWLFPTDPADLGLGFDALWRLWIPEGGLAKLDKRTHGNASAWVEDGWLTLTPGEVADYDYITEQINRDRAAFRVSSIGYDPWNATQPVTTLLADNAPMLEVRQGFVSLSTPTKEVVRLLHKGTRREPLLRHGGNPALRWMTDNLVLARDASDNVKPDKARSADKIDGWAAMVTARAVADTAPPPSAYEDRGLMVV